jgi:hypothetical protein
MYRSKLALGAALAAGAAATQVAAAESPRTTAAAAQGSLSVSPSIVEATARKGATVSPTIANTTGASLRIRVSARPWRQARDGGAVAANRSRRLAGVGLSATRFTLTPNARRSVTAALRRTPSRGSLFGALDVVGKPVKKRKGINVAYRLVSSVRFNPASKRYAVRAGPVRTRGGALSLLVRNAGNTVDPIGGSVSISGPGSGRSATITAVRVLPGNLVALRAASLSGLRRGRYTARFRLSQGGQRRASATRTFRIRR